MSFFGLGETTFNNNISSPLGALSGSDFTLSTLRYPGDLGNIDKSHYIIFYIRVQKDSKAVSKTTSEFGGSNVLGPANDTIASNLMQSVTNSGTSGGIFGGVGDVFSKGVGNLKSFFSPSSSESPASQKIIDNSVKQISGSSFQITKTVKTSDAIALYMPDTLLFDHTQNFENIPLGGDVGGRILAAARSAQDAYQAGGAGGMGASIGKSAAMSVVQEAGEASGKIIGRNSGRALSAIALGAVPNPLLEMIYSSPDFRSFQFEFIFYPRDQKEAREVQSIIQKFYFHQAPELIEDAQGFLLPPSEFDIQFHCNGKQNLNIPVISTCVLTGIMVDYAPTGFSTYEVPTSSSPSIGGTGTPVAIRMSLRFREKTYLTKKDFADNQTNG